MKICSSTRTIPSVSDRYIYLDTVWVVRWARVQIPTSLEPDAQSLATINRPSAWSTHIGKLQQHPRSLLEVNFTPFVAQVLAVMGDTSDHSGQDAPGSSGSSESLSRSSQAISNIEENDENSPPQNPRLSHGIMAGSQRPQQNSSSYRPQMRMATQSFESDNGSSQSSGTSSESSQAGRNVEENDGESSSAQPRFSHGIMAQQRTPSYRLQNTMALQSSNSDYFEAGSGESQEGSLDQSHQLSSPEEFESSAQGGVSGTDSTCGTTQNAGTEDLRERAQGQPDGKDEPDLKKYKVSASPPPAKKLKREDEDTGLWV